MINSIKPDIFIWSASEDLYELRNACLQVTWEAGHDAQGMVSALAHADLSDAIKKADVFVCLSGPKNASIDHACSLATEGRKPILLFLFGVAQEDIKYYRQLLMSAAPGSNLCHLTSLDTYAFVKDYLLALHLLTHAVRAKAVLHEPLEPRRDGRFSSRIAARLLRSIEQWPVVEHRYEKNEELKEAIANFFLDCYLGLIVNGQISRLFFESGSSVAVLSEVFLDRLEEEWLRRSAHLQVETNNLLTYIYFVLSKGFPVDLFPAGPPDKKYGGTYGRLEGVEAPVQNVGAHPIPQLARYVADRIRDHFAELYSESGIIFAATSGIELDPRSEGFGSHTGSFKNMLIKRAHLESGCPIVYFLDEHKLPRPFLPERCFAVCDRDFAWADVCKSKPIALACGFSTEENARPVIAQLQTLGFHHIQEERRGEQPWCFIASNDAFHEFRSIWIERAQAAIGQERGLL